MNNSNVHACVCMRMLVSLLCIGICAYVYVYVQCMCVCICIYGVSCHFRMSTAQRLLSKHADVFVSVLGPLDTAAVAAARLPS